MYVVIHLTLIWKFEYTYIVLPMSWNLEYNLISLDPDLKNNFVNRVTYIFKKKKITCFRWSI